MILLDEFGAPLVIGGFCIPHHSPSAPVADLAGDREVFSIRAFNGFLTRHGSEGVPFTVDALDHTGRFSVLDGANAKLRMWHDIDRGLAFEATDIRATDESRWLVSMIIRGQFTKCSAFGRWHHRDRPRDDGSRLVERVDSIDHVTLCGDDAAYAETFAGILDGIPRGTWQCQAQAAWEASRLCMTSWVPKLAPRPAPKPAAARPKPKASARVMNAARRPVDLDAAERNLDTVLREMRRRR